MTAPVDCILGIDPGLSGACAFYFPGEPEGLTAEDLPIAGNEIDAAQFARRLRQMRPTVAIIERVNAMPKQGVASAFTFGCVYGQMRMAFTAHGIVPARVPAAVWKRSYGLNSDKDAARRLASALLPAHAHNWPLAKHDGRAEAALLALYAVKLDAAEMLT